MSLLMESSFAKIGCGDPGDPIGFSALFNGGSLARIMAAGDRKTCSAHAWVKIVTIDGTRRAIIAANQGSTTRGGILYDGNIEFHDNGSTHRSTTGIYKDAAGWFSLLWRKKSDLAAEVERVEFLINGKLVSTSTGTALAENSLSQFGTASEMRIGDSSQDSAFLAYMAEIVFLDGIYAEQNDFGRFNAFGDWVNKRYAGAYGSNGFHLDFADPVDLGKDISGNSNDFVVSGNLTQSIDTPSNTLAVIDPNSCSSTITLSNGNLTFDRGSNSGYPAGIATIPFSSGVFKAEAAKSLGGNVGVFGVARAAGLSAVGSDFSNCDHLVYIDQAGDVRNNGGVVSNGPDWNGTVGFEVNADTSEVYVTRSTGDRVGPFTLSGSGSIVFFTAAHDFSPPISLNFGQAVFTWAYSEKALELASANQNCPPILDPSRYVQAPITIGGGTVTSLWNCISNKTLVISKRRDIASNWRLNVVIDGVQYTVAIDIDGNQIFDADGLSFTANGFALGSDTEYQGTCEHFVRRASPLAGIDFVLIDNHVSGQVSTIAHNCGGHIHRAWDIPLDGGTIRQFHHKMPAGDFTKVNDAGRGNDPGWFSSTVNTVSLGGVVTGGRHLLILERGVEQFSSFDVYDGNGIEDGPMIPADFAPLWLDVVRGDAAGIPTIRSMRAGEVNPVVNELRFNDGEAQNTISDKFYLLSNGAKCATYHATAGQYTNLNGGKYYTGMYALHPGKFATAR